MQPAPTPATPTPQLTAYCVHCRAKHIIVRPRQEKTTTGGYIVKGQCAECGSNVVRMGKLPEATIT